MQRKLFTLFLLCCLLIPFNRVGAAEAIEKNTVAVHGNGELSVLPDHASIRIGVNSTAETAEKAVRNNAAAAEKIRQGLLSSGVKAKDIRTVTYNVYPQYNREQKVKDYAASYDLAVETSDLANLSNVLDICVRSGANNINSIEFSLADETKYKQEALALAVKDARSKAEVIARALGKRLGGVLSAAEDTANYDRRVYTRNLMKSEAALDAAGQTPILAGNISIRTGISIVFELL